ncbi:hypothetical protein OKA05_18480 [Luteolibacter arcticus]|uniref:DUF2845 domain-containing protein n=1 Tax=Luteolibacter arcticus TaxID=1581411 RepID=A0ABT3GM11_9BACT|nr:hypothetical protein [Luteolibacter arcticus]MCW1924559.1 hypothetical protein [Luteolibacter arcticus]
MNKFSIHAFLALILTGSMAADPLDAFYRDVDRAVFVGVMKDGKLLKLIRGKKVHGKQSLDPRRYSGEWLYIVKESTWRTFKFATYRITDEKITVYHGPPEERKKIVLPVDELYGR